MKTLLIVLYLYSAGTLAAQMVEIPFAVKNTVADKSMTYGITLAAHPKATVDLDTALGEREIPSLPPPAGVFIVYSIPPSKDYMWLSPLDVRPLQTGKQHLVEYTIGMTWNAGSIEISWGQLPALVDSAYIVDVVSDWPDNFIKVKLEPNKTYSTINTAITKLKVLVWYNATSLVVREFENSPLKLSPNPASDFLDISGIEGGDTYAIYDVTGSIVMRGSITGTNVSVPTTILPLGVYNVCIGDERGWNSTRSFVKR